LATVAGIGAVPIPQASDLDSQPAEPHPVQSVGKQIGLDHGQADVFAQAMGAGRETARQASQRKEATDSLLEALKPALVAVTEARKSLSDPDLKPEVAKQRATNVVTAGTSVAASAFPAVLKKTEEALAFAEKLADAALAPEVPEGSEAAHAVRAREIRDRLEVMDPEKRPAAILAAARAGKIETIHAVADDPFGPGLVAPEALRAARREALAALGHTWVSQGLEEARANHTAVASRMDYVLNAIPGAFGLKRPADVPIFSKQATERVAAGKNRINL
jgi:hypothetical protein